MLDIHSSFYVYSSVVQLRSQGDWGEFPTPETAKVRAEKCGGISEGSIFRKKLSKNKNKIKTKKNSNFL